jgi:prenyltransferase beta subunit
MDVFSIASSAKKHLGDDAINKITDFVMSKMNGDGGFRGRSSSSDLYYTFFALATLAALGASKPLAPVNTYIKKLDGAQLGFIDLYCMACTLPLLTYLGLPAKARTLALALTGRNKMFSSRTARKLVERLEEYRAVDGGYNQNIKNSKHGTVYAAYLAFQAYVNLGLEISDKQGILNSLEDLKTPDNGYANQQDMTCGTSTATAAAGILLLYLDGKFPRNVAQWLIGQQMSCGGFRASPQTPIADILSTATAVLALKHAGHHCESKQEIIDFVESHWDDSGGFFGSMLDQHCDCEYTFYALLTLGCLLEE